MTESPSPSPIRILIVDDHAMVRQGLRTFLELQDDPALPIEVAGEAANGHAAVELARRVQPDIVLLDMGWWEGLALIFSYLAVGAFLISYDTLYSRTQADQSESQRLLADL